MDTKRLILSVTLTLGLVLGWQMLRAHLLAEHPGWAQQAESQPPAVPAVAPVPTTSPVAIRPTTNSSVATTVSTGLAAIGATQPTSAAIGSDPAIFPMVLAVDPQGAGLKSITLSDYYDTAAHKDVADKSHLYKFEEPLVGFESVTRPLATRTITVNDTDIDVSNVIWKQAESSRSSVTYTATVLDSGLPALELTKTFTLLPRDAKDGSRGFDVAVHQGFRNLTGKPIKASVTLNGPTPPARENDLSEDRRYVAGYDDGDKTVDTGGRGRPAN